MNLCCCGGAGCCGDCCGDVGEDGVAGCGGGFSRRRRCSNVQRPRGIGWCRLERRSVRMLIAGGVVVSWMKYKLCSVGVLAVGVGGEEGRCFPYTPCYWHCGGG